MYDKSVILNVFMYKAVMVQFYYRSLMRTLKIFYDFRDTLQNGQT